MTTTEQTSQDNLTTMHEHVAEMHRQTALAQAAFARFEEYVASLSSPGDES